MFKRRSESSSQSEQAEQPFVSRRGQKPPQPKKTRVSRPESNINSKEGASLLNRSFTSSAKGSWRNASINNLEQQKKQEVDRQIKEKNKIINRRKNLKVTLKITAVIVLFFIGYLLLCLTSKRVELKLEGVPNANTEYTSSIKSAVDKSVGGGIIGYVKPAFNRYDSIRKDLVVGRDDVDRIDMKFNLFKLRTEVKLKVNVPIIKWISPEGRATYVNQKGQVYEPPKELVDTYKPLEIGGTGLGATSNSKIPVSADKLAWIVSLVPELRNGGLAPSKVNVISDSIKSVEVLLEGKSVRLIFSTEEDAAGSGISAVKSVKFLESSREGGVKGLSYIDVRSPERVLYK